VNANARGTTLRRQGEHFVGIRDALVMQNGDFRDAQDKTNQTKNQKPKGSFYRQYHRCDQNRRHDPINNDR
jgi:hypothetical protein